MHGLGFIRFRASRALGSTTPDVRELIFDKYKTCARSCMATSIFRPPTASRTGAKQTLIGPYLDVLTCIYTEACQNGAKGRHTVVMQIC